MSVALSLESDWSDSEGRSEGFSYVLVWCSCIVILVLLLVISILMEPVCVDTVMSIFFYVVSNFRV